jgi:hypothetical protein
MILKEAALIHALQILEVTNDAFMADAFFKKDEYHLRFTLESVNTMISAKDSVFIIALDDNMDGSEMVLGSLYLHWELYADEISRDLKV